MAILNLIDRRRRRHRWRSVNAVVEPTWHDNSIVDADHAPSDEEADLQYDERRGVSVADAVAWASAFDADVTLYVYDEGDGL